MKQIILSLALFSSILFAANPFDYDLDIVEIPGSNSRTLIAMHGFGQNNQTAQKLKELNLVESTIIGFNFPDYDFKKKDPRPKNVSCGTIQELLPAIYVLKEKVIDQNLDSIDLYGFSAGGGALINTIAVLNTTIYDKELAKIGVGEQEKAKLLSAIQKGVIVLDSPLKSVEEIMDHKGSSFKLWFLARKYKKNQLRPIDSIEKFRGLSLKIILYFESPDEILYNRDDSLFAERLLEINNKGSTTVLIGSHGGHLEPHLLVLDEYNRSCCTHKI